MRSQCWYFLISREVSVQLCPTAVDHNLTARTPNRVNVRRPFPDDLLSGGVAVDHLQQPAVFEGANTKAVRETEQRSFTVIVQRDENVLCNLIGELLQIFDQLGLDLLVGCNLPKVDGMSADFLAAPADPPNIFAILPV